MLLYARIIHLCKTNNLTIKQLEDSLEFGNGTLRRWNKSVPYSKSVIKVADYFNVSVDYLV